jgi:N-hydroxyarylamine O-acetyltransferase
VNPYFYNRTQCAIDSSFICYAVTVTSLLNAYLARIGYTGDRAPTRAALIALHRAHVTQIAYENLDIHLGREVVMDEAAIWDKIVNRGRGGWCFEMTRVFAVALRDLGFRFDLLAGRVGSLDAPDHACLRVWLDGAPWLADVGFGNGLRQPIPLAEGTHEYDGYGFSLARDGAGWLYRQLHDGQGFAFADAACDWQAYAPQCAYLQTSPDSGFVRVAVCHRWADDGIISLRGCTFTRAVHGQKTTHTVETREAYAQRLRQDFLLRLRDDEIDALWAKVWSAHLAWVASGRS